MPCWRSTNLLLSAASRLLIWLALLLPSTGATAAGFQVLEARSYLSGDTYRLETRLQLELTAEVKDALESGVPLTIAVDAQVLRQRRFVWDDRLVSKEVRYELKTHPLSGQYLVRNLSSGELRTFSNLVAAIDSLSHVQQLFLVEAQKLNPQEAYSARVRVRLDIESLPAPLRPTAHFSEQWNLQSGWQEWPIVH